MLNILAIGDLFIPGSVMDKGLESLRQNGAKVTVREWTHPSFSELQEDNIIIEQQGPEAVKPPAELTNDIENYDMLIFQFFPLGKDLIDKAKKLKVVGVLRGGLENVDCEYAASKNIEVINTPGRNSRAVAEMTVGLLLAEMRNIARSHYALKHNQWRKDYVNKDIIPELLNKTVGIVGYGNVGKLVAKFLKGFGANIVFYDPYAKPDSDDVKSVDIETLVKTADMITLNLRLTKESYHLIGEKEISMLKPMAIIVNTSRSGVIDEKALVKALQDKKIAGAGLDVFDNEPPPPDDPILALDNVTITNHCAGTTSESFSNSPALFAGRFIKSHKHLF
jgi:D-3-phosphoglycerate dehydrogenase